MNLIIERLFDRIGEIDDSFLEEALLVDIAGKKATKRKRLTQGTASVAVVAGVIAIAYWRVKRKGLAKSA